ncbi:extracellular solute-binding protein [Paenibacillus sp. sptzw28]|uniref:extracellular solute-binding protein n=1 Tax=Paenibacillus sp. sptzw28 TaxID=715179 RepID=UPI001C6F4039|nr:extracellular solute-binding protein [Paenibacillus sp. sptzw28]QYR21748.1 extracellular solute-binding protein [Paenibacillus sp. sptzw28]
MNNKVKALSIAATAMLSVLIAAGCSSNSSGNNMKGDSKEPAKKPVISQSIYDRGTVPPDEGTIEKNRWTDWINENAPATVRFTAIPRWESQAKFNTLFASTSAPDLIFEFDTNYRNQLYNQKQLMPLDDLIAKHSTVYKKQLEQNPVLKKIGTKPDGKLYEFGRIVGLSTNHVLYVRADWLKELNFEVPKTTDDLYKVIKAFTEQDPDNNGKNDTFGYSLSFVTGYITDSMFQNVAWVVEDGKLIHDWDRSKAATAFKKKLYDEGLIDKDFLADKNGEKAKQDFINGKLGFYGVNGGGGAPGLQILEAMRKNDPNSQMIPIELPQSPFGQFSPVIQNPVQMTAVINASAKDPRAVMKYVDFLVSEPTQKTLSKGIEGTHWKNGANGCPEVIVDEARQKKELSWMGDFILLNSSATWGKCADFASTLDPSKPLEKEFLGIIDMAKKAYLDPVRPIAELTSSEHMPTLPQDLQLIVTNANKTIADTINKAIVSGASYTVEQAIEDAKSTWEKSGGKQVDDWYAKWYVENKDKAFLKEDMYKMRNQ